MTAVIYLGSAILYSILVAWGWASAQNRSHYHALVIVVTLGAASLWVAYGIAAWIAA